MRSKVCPYFAYGTYSYVTFDRNGVGTYGAYHHKSELKHCNRVQYFFNPPKFAVVIAILEPATSTRTDNSAGCTLLVQGVLC